MKKILLGVSVLTVIAGAVKAQDPHFTQYFASPLTLNPALTGLTQCDIRLAANYRQQWASVSSNPYTTGTISYDMSTLKGKLNNGDAVGVGLLALYDKSGAGGLQNITIGLSAAYHKALGTEKKHTISLGAQGYLVQKNVDFNKLKFEDQFDAATGTTPYMTGEPTGNSDVTYSDFNAGLMYSGRVAEHATAYAGFSYYHFTRPVEQFLQGTYTNRIHSRYTAYLGGSFDMNENTVLYASALYQSQASATEVLAGAAVGFILNPGHDEEFQKNTIFYVGGWYRYGDAVAPYISFEWSKMQLGISYDVNVSSFSPATKGQGAYEVSLIFNGCINKRTQGPNYNFSCPKF
jgi:type IX secretion system PorP/SprF family membrane protein